MKLFRLRFILLGLLLCIFHVWCRTCGSEFNDPESKAVLADVIIEGKLSQKLPPNLVDRFNYTVRVRKVIKGQEVFGARKVVKKYLTIGFFGPVLDAENCVSNLTRSDQKYYFFLKTTDRWNYLLLSTFPEKQTRKIGRKMKKIVTCRNCVKAPRIRRVKGRKSVKEGRGLQLRCQIGSVKPPPIIHWEKDGEIIRKKKGIHIKTGRKGSKLKIRRSKSVDSGTYFCVVKNVNGTDRKSIKVRVVPKKEVTAVTTEATTSPPRFKNCRPEDSGWCLNGGECRIFVKLDMMRTCKCPRAYIGDRCELLDPNAFPDKDSRRASLEKDRTLTIIGIVIGLLLFICICIASYFLAKRRRERYFRRQEEKRRQSQATNNIPAPYLPSYQKVPSIDTELGNSFSQPIPFKRLCKNSETQTDEPNYPNPYTNINLYHNPMEESSILRNPPPPSSDRNSSRSRLSGISAGNRNSDRPTSAGNANFQGAKYPGYPAHEKDIPGKSRQSGYPEKEQNIQPRSSGPESKNNRNSIPKLRQFSEVISDEENDQSLPSLHISEDDIQSQNNKNSTKDTSSPAVVNDSSSSYSDGSVSSSVENLRHLNNIKDQDGGISWNERGSPELKVNTGYNNKFFNNSENMYPKSSKHNDKDRKGRHASDPKARHVSDPKMRHLSDQKTRHMSDPKTRHVSDQKTRHVSDPKSIPV